MTVKWPVLHAGSIPSVNLATWTFEVSGEVENPVSLSWDELNALPRTGCACEGDAGGVGGRREHQPDRRFQAMIGAKSSAMFSLTSPNGVVFPAALEVAKLALQAGQTYCRIFWAAASA